MISDFSYEILSSADDVIMMTDYFDDLADYDRFLFRAGHFFLFRIDSRECITSAMFIGSAGLLEKIKQLSILPIVKMGANGVMDARELSRVTYKGVTSCQA